MFLRTKEFFFAGLRKLASITVKAIFYKVTTSQTTLGLFLCNIGT